MTIILFNNESYSRYFAAAINEMTDKRIDKTKISRYIFLSLLLHLFYTKKNSKLN